MATDYMYGGKSYSMDPKYSSAFGGYGVGFKDLAITADARTANQIKELGEQLNSGIRNIEIGVVQPNVFEAIPKEHFKEMRQLAKLSGAELTFHAPMIDPTGITERGWDKLMQKNAEDQLWNSMKLAKELNPNGTVVTFHAASSGLPAAEMKYKEGDEVKTKSMIFINKSNGTINQTKEEERYFDSEKGDKRVEFDPTKELARLNETTWMQQVSNLNFQAERGATTISQAMRAKEQLSNMPENKSKNHPETEELLEQKKRVEQELKHGKIFLRDSYRNLRELYDECYGRITDDKQKQKLNDFVIKVKPFVENGAYEKLSPDKLGEFSDIIEEGVNLMGEMRPKIFENIRNFAVEKSAETTANLALRSFKEFGSSAPIIAIENHPAQQALISTAEDLRDVVQQARNNFVEKAKKTGMSEGEARKQAEKLIGATWDVGHINMLRRYGYNDKDLIKQSEIIAPFVKKVHLSDNFGFEHTELPMGMGNVPMKEIMEKFKAGTPGYKDVKKIIEAGDWWQHFAGQGGKFNTPITPTLQNFGSALYGQMNYGAQIPSVPGRYFGGYGTMLPENNFNMYGAGFSSLPTELGGQIANKDSRLSGTPMA
jgi:sugar phosphate isomerase/epimerase